VSGRSPPIFWGVTRFDRRLWPSRLLLHRDALAVEQLLQLAGLEHLADDVAAADELALDVELRDGRPVAVDLDAFAHGVVGQHVDALVGHAEVAEDLGDLAGEAALREVRRAFHEQHDVVRLHFVVDLGVDVGHLAFPAMAWPGGLPAAASWSV